MKINLSKEDLKKLYSLLDYKEINISVADLLLSIYEEKDYFKDAKNVSDYYEKMVSFFGVPTEEKEERKILNKWIKPAIFPLKPASFLENPYFKHIQPSVKKMGKYALEYLCYKAYQPLPLDDVIIDQNDYYLERTPIGYFEQDFKYLSLSYEGVTWMCITPNEINTMQPHIGTAKGNVLVLGLGLGYYPYMISLKEEVKDIYIVELDQNIINIFEENILPLFEHKEKIHIIKGDAKEYIKSLDGKFDTVFIDLWHGAGDGLPLYLYFKQYEKKYPKCHFQYWLENSLIALYRRYLLMLIEESLNGYTDKDYLHSKNELDKFINELYFKTKNITINSYDDVYKLLSDNSISRLF